MSACGVQSAKVLKWFSLNLIVANVLKSGDGTSKARLPAFLKVRCLAALGPLSCGHSSADTSKYHHPTPDLLVEVQRGGFGSQTKILSGSSVLEGKV